MLLKVDNLNLNYFDTRRTWFVMNHVLCVFSYFTGLVERRVTS